MKSFYLRFRGFGVQLLHEWDEPAANGIANRNRDKRLEHCHLKIASKREVEHVCNAVLETAQDKDHHREEHDKHFPDLVFYGLVAVCRDEHEHPAENPEYEQTSKTIAVLDHAKCVSFSLKCRAIAGRSNQLCKNESTDKISEPDYSQKAPIINFIVDKIADLARKKVEPEI